MVTREVLSMSHWTGQTQRRQLLPLRHRMCQDEPEAEERARDGSLNRGRVFCRTFKPEISFPDLLVERIAPLQPRHLVEKDAKVWAALFTGPAAHRTELISVLLWRLDALAFICKISLRCRRSH